MRRPLDWMVVSIALLVLFANRLLVERPSGHEPTRPVANTVAWRVTPAETPSPFAWIQEDGTEVAVPAQPTHAMRAASESQPRHATGAVYTWSAPLVEARPRPPTLQ